MALHRLTSVTMGVPNVTETIGYYSEFGLEHLGEGSFATRDGGKQLRVVYAPTRRLVELGVGADGPDDIAQISARLERLGVPRTFDGNTLRAIEPVSGFTARIEVAPRIVQVPVAATLYNGPGRIDRYGRAPGVVRETPVRPKKLGHCVVGTTNLEATMGFFTEGLGFKISDYIGDKGAFMRCSVDHHNVLALAAPVNFLHHTSWQVDDIDDIGRGVKKMLEGNPHRHVWGLGRHHAGSNFFWYLKDPAGNFSEYYSDMDCIPEDEIWTPETFFGAQGLFNWGPPPPPSFLEPEDLTALMAGQHSPGIQ
ncbi:VOC family protein [Pseudarthrobacter raffinosi]|uniref:VOC family protein n=1 Tax=Pseudarthrobacter raffinosi TaxID=2953651 RepID=UPI00208F003C|nr:VOC family protein [Pseudarthrobacter sp. MDT3-9]MCO4252142.1 VOC family protein [Pseudarthrobacter sp. MDT3-9]